MTRGFDHRDAGTAEEVWTAALAGLRELHAPSQGEHVVVVAAHPDDETLGAGGLISAAAAQGARVTVLVATDGEASHPGSRTHSPDQLAALRRREVYAAITVLAPEADVHLLGLPDGQLAAHEGELSAAIEAVADGCTHLVTPWSGDRHPDHEACSRAACRSSARRASVHWQYPIWAWHWAEPGRMPDAQLRRLPLGDAAQLAKARAIECHRSQHAALSPEPGDEALLSERVLAHFRRDAETFVVASSLPSHYFDDLYADADDPWGLAERFYENRKRAVLLAALVRPRFRRAFEPGCATGLLTAQLARRCDEVMAWDVAESATRQTAERLGDMPNVSVGTGRIPDEWPAGEFDLIVISEVGYYCADLDALVARVDESLTDDGVLVACHWRHHAAAHPHGAGTVHAALGARRKIVVNHVEDDFLLQAWTRSGTSVAAEEGIVP